MNAIVTTAPTWLAYAEMERLAVAIAKSGLFGIRTPEQAIVLMQIAQAEGRHPALAARDYDIIQGRPAKKAEAMHRDFLAGGGKVEWTTLTDDTADATFSHPQGGTARIIWDTDRAALAGLEKKENWKKYPRQMLRNRVVSEGVRTVWPMATSGMHLPEELGDAGKPPANDGAFTGTTLDAEDEAPVAPIHDAREQMNRDVPLKAVKNPAPRPPRTIGHLLDAVRIGLNNATSRVEVDRILDSEDVLNLRANVPADSPAILRLDEMRAEALERFPPMADEDEALPEVEIIGADKVMAGD